MLRQYCMIDTKKGPMMASEKWTLAEGIEKLLPHKPEEEPEIIDVGTSRRQLCLDISIAEGQSAEDGRDGISVILEAPGIEPEEDEEYPRFNGFFPLRKGETSQDVVARVATILGIQSDERVW